MKYSYLPPFLFESKLFTQLYNSVMKEATDYRSFLQEVLNQCFVDSATWGLDFWEEYLSIKTDKSMTYEFRRENIKSRMRGYGIISKNAIKDICETFALAEVEVNELSNFTFEVKFVGLKGIPPNLVGLQRRIEELKPAHLLVKYTFVYTIWREVGQLKWSEVKSSTWSELRVREVT